MRARSYFSRRANPTLLCGVLCSPRALSLTGTASHLRSPVPGLRTWTETYTEAIGAGLASWVGTSAVAQTPALRTPDALPDALGVPVLESFKILSQAPPAFSPALGLRNYVARPASEVCLGENKPALK